MYNILLTGATGMVGKGILLECLEHPQIKSITLISRTSVGFENPKVIEILLNDFMELDTIKDQLAEIDACFHCMGVTSVNKSEEQFSQLTFDITKKLADICFQLNPRMTFNYVSGTGTDSSEKGRVMWARVKGRTENYILNSGFEKSYMFRPGLIIPEKGIKSRTPLYNSVYYILWPFFPILKRMKGITTTTKVGMAMINSVLEPQKELKHFENKDINQIADGH